MSNISVNKTCIRAAKLIVNDLSTNTQEKLESLNQKERKCVQLALKVVSAEDKKSQKTNAKELKELGLEQLYKIHEKLTARQTSGFQKVSSVFQKIKNNRFLLRKAITTKELSTQIKAINTAKNSIENKKKEAKKAFTLQKQSLRARRKEPEIEKLKEKIAEMDEALNTQRDEEEAVRRTGVLKGKGKRLKDIKTTIGKLEKKKKATEEKLHELEILSLEKKIEAEEKKYDTAVNELTKKLNSLRDKKIQLGHVKNKYKSCSKQEDYKRQTMEFIKLQIRHIKNDSLKSFLRGLYRELNKKTEKKAFEECFVEELTKIEKDYRETEASRKKKDSKKVIYQAYLENTKLTQIDNLKEVIDVSEKLGSEELKRKLATDLEEVDSFYEDLISEFEDILLQPDIDWEAEIDQFIEAHLSEIEDDSELVSKEKTIISAELNKLEDDDLTENEDPQSILISYGNYLKDKQEKFSELHSSLTLRRRRRKSSKSIKQKQAAALPRKRNEIQKTIIVGQQTKKPQRKRKKRVVNT